MGSESKEVCAVVQMIKLAEPRVQMHFKHISIGIARQAHA